MKKIILPFIILPCMYISACTSTNNNTYQDVKTVEPQIQFATDILVREFGNTTRALQVLENASRCLDEGMPIPKETFVRIIEVVSEFNDKCHQEKEDRLLFPMVKDKEDGKNKHFLGRLLMEHVSSRDMMRDLTTSLENFIQGKKAKKKITKIAYAYVKHTKKHIQTEEKVLFPWVNKVLTSDEQKLLISKFESIEQEKIHAGLHEKYSGMLDELENQLELRKENTL